MYKVVGDRLVSEKTVQTSKQLAIIKSEIDVVENPNNETLEIEEIPQRPVETEAHYPVLILNNGILAYELRERPKPVEDIVNDLQQQLTITQEAIDFLIMNGGM